MIHIAILTTGDDRVSERYSGAVAYEPREGFDFETEWNRHHANIETEARSKNEKPDNYADATITEMEEDGWKFLPSDSVEVYYS